ncbi:MAG TPA: urate hydroxylase PuuD [Candidatus Binataceae bacterium]|nr:urate hydroxylase PuuD [Candidatus Binataceae bacterium]
MGMAAVLMLLRWAHFLFGITWIGLLYYFNFVQTPFFAETDPPVRSGAQQKLLPRALWWFRWGAMGTIIAGLGYFFIWQSGRAFQSWHVAIITGGTMGILMWANVWFVIWPKQKIVIANAIAVAGGAPANPAAAGAGRRASIASRTNVLFSIPMLFFMGAASHYPLAQVITQNAIWEWIIIVGGIIALVELNALVGTQGATKKPLDSISGVIWAGFILWIVLTAIIMMLFS